MKTLYPHEITDADRPFLVSRGHADGRVTLYYPGDEIPPIPQPTGPVVPDHVTKRQARAVLILTPHPQAGTMLAAVEAALDAIEDPVQRALARNEWDHSGVVERHRGLVSQVAGALGLSDEQLDAMFIAAAAIP